jgi:hypothetical protein
MKTKQVFSAVLVLAASGLGGCGGGSGDPGNQSEYLLPNRAGIYTEATAHYGPLYVHEMDANSDESFVVADTHPWAGYWYPLRDGILVKPTKSNDGTPTLEKYDRYSKAIFGKASTAVREEIKSGLYNDRADSWEGRCHAWAMAAVLEAEPVLPPSGVKVPGSDVTFYTRDVKALMIKAYERVDNDAFRLYGQPFEYSEDQSQDYQDIYPDQFHRVLQAELFERKRPVVMDGEAGSEVWNYPVWQALTVIKRDASDPHVMHVQTKVLATQSMGISPDLAGSSPKTDSWIPLEYDLMGDPQADGRLLVKYGKWTGESVKNHPDFVMSLPSRDVPVKHWSANKQLELSVIGDIMARTRAFSRSLEIFGDSGFLLSAF